MRNAVAARPRPTPKAESPAVPPAETAADPATPLPPAKSREAVRLDRQMLHGPGLASHVYQSMVKPVANDPELRDTAFGHAADVVCRLGCRDPLEEMLAMQAMWAHARVARLSAMANHQSARDNVKAINECCDRASDTYRKLMLALAEYRRPPRTPGVHVTTYGQANVAQQQVVQQVAATNATNEQG